MTRCGVCRRPVDHDHDPHQPEGHYDHDHWEVVMRNRLRVDSCFTCWSLWPDPWKVFPSRGFGRDWWDDPAQLDDDALVSIDDFNDLPVLA